MSDLDFSKDFFSNIDNAAQGHPTVYPLLRDPFLSSAM
jgi:hypothetical protein